MAEGNPCELESLAVVLNVEGATSHVIANGWTATEGLKFKSLVVPRVVENNSAEVTFFDLPLKPPAMRSAVSHLVDVIQDYDGDFDLSTITTSMMESNYESLPVPLCPKMAMPPGYTMQLVICKTAPRTYTIVKHYRLAQRLRGDILQDRLAHGDMFFLQRTANTYRSLISFQYVFEKLGGILFLYNAWLPPRLLQDGKPRDKEHIEAGYKFILEEAPMSNQKMEQFIFAELLAEEEAVFNAALHPHDDQGSVSPGEAEGATPIQEQLPTSQADESLTNAIVHATGQRATEADDGLPSDAPGDTEPMSDERAGHDTPVPDGVDTSAAPESAGHGSPVRRTPRQPFSSLRAPTRNYTLELSESSEDKSSDDEPLKMKQETASSVGDRHAVRTKRTGSVSVSSTSSIGKLEHPIKQIKEENRNVHVYNSAQRTVCIDVSDDDM